MNVTFIIFICISANFSLSAEEVVKNVLLKNSMRVEGEKSEYSWSLRFLIDSRGQFIYPKKCHDFKLMVKKIYDPKFIELIQRAKKVSLGESTELRDVQQVESILEKANELILAETNRVVDSFFYSASTNYISRKLNFSDIECDCRSLFVVKEGHEDFILDFIIISSLLEVKNK